MWYDLDMALMEEELFKPGDLVEHVDRPAWGTGQVVAMVSFDDGMYLVRWLREDKAREVTSRVSSSDLLRAS